MIVTNEQMNESLKENLKMHGEIVSHAMARIEVLEAENKEQKTAISELEDAMERWHHARDNDGETLQKINDILLGIGKLEWFNKK